MKKIKYLLIMVIAIMVSVSCSNDDDANDVHPLVGSWGFTLSEDGVEISATITFNANLTGSSVATVKFLDEEQETENESFTWNTDGNKLTIIVDGETEISTYVILGNKLTVKDGDGITVLTRQ